MEISGEIDKLCQDLLNLYKKNLEESGHNASHNLENSATYSIKTGDYWFELYFNLEDYWKYLEYGTNPHFPPVSAIEEWIKVKPIVPDNRGEKIPNTKQLAYLIGRKISIEGTKPTHILENTLNSDLVNTLVEQVGNIIVEQINKEIENEIFG